MAALERTGEGPEEEEEADDMAGAEERRRGRGRGTVESERVKMESQQRAQALHHSPIAWMESGQSREGEEQSRVRVSRSNRASCAFSCSHARHRVGINACEHGNAH